MTANTDWLPAAEPEQLIIVQNLEDKIDKYATNLEIATAELAKTHTLLQTFVEVVSKNIQNQATAVAYTAFKNSIKNGVPSGEPAPAAPVFEATTLPAGATVGVVEQLRKLRNRWLLADGYTPEIGADLMIVGTARADRPDADLVAVLKITEPGGYVIGCAFSKQGKDAMRVQWRYAGTEAWTAGGDFTASPAAVSVPPTTPNQPVTVEVRGHLMEKNQPVGLWSPIYTAFATP